MKSSKLFVACVFTALIIFSSCKKDDKTNTVSSNFDFSLKFGSTNQTANINIYSSLVNYNTNTAVIVTGRTDADGLFSFPASKLIKGQQYFVDIYTDDAKYNNWFGSMPKTFTYTDANKNFIYKSPSPTDDFVRKVYLNIIDTVTNWKAIDASDGNINNSIWNTLTANEQYKKIKLRKDLSGVVMEKNSSGSLIVNNITFTPGTQIILSTANVPIFARLDKHLVKQLDTIMVSGLNGSPYRFTMVKE